MREIIETTIERLENIVKNQQSIDDVYNDLCEIYYAEMNSK